MHSISFSLYIKCIYIYTYVCMCTYIYIYIERERERDRYMYTYCLVLGPTDVTHVARVHLEELPILKLAKIRLTN